MAKVLRTSLKIMSPTRQLRKHFDKSFAAVGPSAVLPDEYAEPCDDFNRYSLLIHGEKKIGKTSIALQGGKVLLLQFDPPQLAYKRMEIVIETWKHYLAVLRNLETAKPFPYDRVVIDGAEQWYRMAFDHACSTLAVDDPGDEGYGKGWNLVRRTFAEGVDRFLRLSCGRWFTAHSMWREVETRQGTKIMKLLPTLSKQAEEILNGRVDGWFAYDYVEDKRVLIVQGDEHTGAGHRFDESGFEHFRTPKGRVVREIDMGSSPAEAYQNLMKGFDNKLLTTKVDEGVVPPVKPTPKFAKKR